MINYVHTCYISFHNSLFYLAILGSLNWHWIIGELDKTLGEMLQGWRTETGNFEHRVFILSWLDLYTAHGDILKHFRLNQLLHLTLGMLIHLVNKYNQHENKEMINGWSRFMPQADILYKHI